MARAEAEALQKLLPVLRQLREIKGVQETKPGIFYARRDAFIHFHDEGGALFADLKKPGGSGFDRYPLDTPAQQRKLVDDAKLRAQAPRRRVSGTDSRAGAGAASSSTRSRRATPAQREAELLAALAAQIAQRAGERARRSPSGCAASIRATIASRAALAALPVLRKHELLERQTARREPATRSAASRRSAGAARATRRGARRASSPRPGRSTSPRARAPDYWRMARALFAAGFRAGDLVHNSFSYHFTPAGAMMESGAQAIGCTVFPAGTGQTELQVQAMAALRPDAYVGTPSFLRLLLEKADELGVAVAVARPRPRSAARRFRAPLRDWLRARAASPRYQSYGTADLGLVAYETEAREGLVVDEGVIVEIVRPGTGDPVADGEVGEVVVTTLNPDYPLIRFGTGDLSAVLPGALPDRPHQPAHPRLARPRRPVDQGARHVRASAAGGRDRAPPSGDPPRAAGRQRRDGRRPDDAATSRSKARRPKASPSASPRRSAT